MRTPILKSKREGGIVLFMALIMLVAMSLIGLALFRSVDTSTMIANNLGYRQSAIAAADKGTEVAINWILTNKSSLTSDHPESGYYATDQAGTDFTKQATPSTTSDDVDWSGNGGTRRAKVVNSTPDAAGNKIAYIIHRMCDQPGTYGASSTIQCAVSSSTVSTGGSQGVVSYGSYSITGKTMIYYRITTRTDGARNSVSYLQTMVLVEY